MASLVLVLGGSGFVLISVLRAAGFKDHDLDDWLITVMMILAGAVLLFLSFLA